MNLETRWLHRAALPRQLIKEKDFSMFDQNTILMIVFLNIALNHK